VYQSQVLVYAVSKLSRISEVMALLSPFKMRRFHGGPGSLVHLVAAK
jgi:hypothetical protein